VTFLQSAIISLVLITGAAERWVLDEDSAAKQSSEVHIKGAAPMLSLVPDRSFSQPCVRSLCFSVWFNHGVAPDETPEPCWTFLFPGVELGPRMRARLCSP
jgi:hypothetical protein